MVGSGLQKPVLIMADVNISSQEFMTTTMSTVMQVSEVATGEATCNTGNELDSALVCTDLVWADLDRDHHHPQKELLQRFGLKPNLTNSRRVFWCPTQAALQNEVIGRRPQWVHDVTRPVEGSFTGWGASRRMPVARGPRDGERQMHAGQVEEEGRL